VVKNIKKQFRAQKKPFIVISFQVYLKKYKIVIQKRKYLVRLNHGLIEDGKLLPSNVAVRITLHRASSKKALLDIGKSGYDSQVIPLIDPILKANFKYSPALTQKMGRIRSNGIDIKFPSYDIRYRILDDGLIQYTVPIQQGKLPTFMVFFLMTPERFAGSFGLSSGKFEMNGLREFSIELDSEPLEGYPLKMRQLGDSLFTTDFYRAFLEKTMRYKNVL